MKKKQLSGLVMACCLLAACLTLAGCGRPQEAPQSTVPTAAPVTAPTAAPTEEATVEALNAIPPEAREFNGHHYCIYHVDYALTWDEAQAFCESVGGYLATLTSRQENDFVYSLLTEQGMTAGSFGLKKVGAGEEWKWVTGEAFSYENWADGEPSDANGMESYGAFYRDYTDGEWNDAPAHCDTFICEWGGYHTAEEQMVIDKTPRPLG